MRFNTKTDSVLPAKNPLLWALLFLFVGLALTASCLAFYNNQKLTSVRVEYEERLEHLTDTLETQFGHVLYGLRGVVGLDTSLGELSWQVFSDYVATLNLSTDYPGVQGFGVVERIARSDLPNLKVGASDKAPDFELQTKGDAPDLYVVSLIEPYQAFAGEAGRDLGVNPQLREAIERAIDTGEPSLSAALPMKYEKQEELGFLYFVPVYKRGAVLTNAQERRAAVKHIFYAQIDAKTLLKSTENATSNSSYFEIFDGFDINKARLIFSNQNGHVTQATVGAPSNFADTSKYHKDVRVEAGGRVFTLHTGSTPYFQSLEDSTITARIIVTSGSFLSLLLSSIIWLLLSGRARSQKIVADMTRELSNSLRETRDLLYALDQNLSVSITDSDGNIIFANALFSKLTGYSNAELMGKNHRILKSDVQPAGFWEDMWRIVSNGGVWRGVVCNRSKNGSLYWVDAVVVPIFNEHGIGKYVSIRIDISAAREAQEALQQERQNLSNIIMGTGAGTWELDVQSGLIDCNERWVEMIGYTLPELMPMSTDSLAGICHPDDLVMSNQMIEDYFAGLTDALDTQLRMRHKDGHWVWVHTLAKISARDANGHPLRLSGTNIDITTQKLAEEAMARTSAMLQAVLDSASDVAVITTGLDNIISLFNKGAERLLGYSAEDVVGKHSSTLFMEAANDIAAPGRSNDAGYEHKIEATYIHKNGRRMTVALFKSGLLDQHGEQVGQLSISYDISNEKEYEKSLRDAMQAAQAATIAKSQFLANMSHELRTPMNAILGMLRLLQSTDLSVRQQDYAGKTEMAAKSLLGLLNDILDLSKIDAGKMELDPQPFRMDQLLRDLSVILSSSVVNKELEVLFDLDAALPLALVGDAMRLKQILINLGGNAIKFTVKGNVVLKIRVLARTDLETTLAFSVIDTGIGIAPEHQERIFEGFSQAEASTTRRYGGSGLGLSICKRLVGMMGGQLTLSSVLDQGSTFSFTLTLPNTNLFRHEIDANTSRLPGALRVLVVDDNPLACEIMQSMAWSWGWTLDQAHSGAEAIALVQAKNAAGAPPYQAIFMDWFMPEMDGWETIKRLRPLFPAHGMPLVLMVTAHGSEILNALSEHEQSMLDGFLVKPLTASMLFDAVVDANLARSGAARQGPALIAGIGKTATITTTASKQSAQLAGLRILLVEDNQINQQVAQELLSAEGALVSVAENGQLALDALSNASLPFDVVLMDIHMPVMDGFTATRFIREQLGNFTLPIIAMTANAMASDREECLAAGMNDHIGKPFDLSQLIVTLLRHTASSQAAQKPVAQAQNDMAALPASAMLDVGTALVRMGGNATFYQGILRSYLSELSALPEKMAELLEKDAERETHHLMHTFKGLSATVGADALCAVATAAEAALPPVANQEARLALLGKIRTVVGETTRAANDYLQAFGIDTHVDLIADDAVDRPAVHSMLLELQSLLKNADMRALDVHAGLRAIIGTRAAPALAALSQAVGVFDFDLAAERCQTLLDQFSEVQ
ncbi:MAG: PAS domain S-box protein [Burkholderiaceae bacterium]